MEDIEEIKAYLRNEFESAKGICENKYPNEDHDWDFWYGWLKAVEKISYIVNKD